MCHVFVKIWKDKRETHVLSPALNIQDNAFYTFRVTEFVCLQSVQVIWEPVQGLLQWEYSPSSSFFQAWEGYSNALFILKQYVAGPLFWIFIISSNIRNVKEGNTVKRTQNNLFIMFPWKRRAWKSHWLFRMWHMDWSIWALSWRVLHSRGEMLQWTFSGEERWQPSWQFWRVYLNIWLSVGETEGKAYKQLKYPSR